MSYGTVVMKKIIILLFSFIFFGTNGEICYVIKIMDNVLSCDNFNNDLLDCNDLKVCSEKGDEGDDTAKLSGKIKTLAEIVSDYDIEIDIWKILDLGEEYMYSTRMNFCSSLENKDSPYYPIIEKLNMTRCPVDARTIEVHGMTIPLDAVKDVLNHETCGNYKIQTSMMDAIVKKSCHVFEVRIEEHDM